MSNTKLRECPFCGGEAILKRMGTPYSVGCDDSECLGWHYKNWQFDEREQAIEAWNTRKPMDDIVERLEQKAEKCRNRGFEAEEKGFFATADTYYGKKSSYFHAIAIVRNAGKDGAE